jgi:hypothetical protein
MTRKTDTKVSPKGLIKIRTMRGWDQDHGFRLEAISPGTYAIKGPSTTDMIRSHVAFLHKFASDCIVQAGHDPAQYRKMLGSATLDRAWLAAHMLKTIDDLERHLSRLEGSDLDSAARQNALAALHSTLILASEFHSWTVVDNEPAIDARIRSVDGAKRGQAGKARAIQARNETLVREYLARRSKPGGLSDSALMQEIGRSEGLGRSASIDAIKRGLQNLK